MTGSGGNQMGVAAIFRGMVVVVGEAVMPE